MSEQIEKLIPKLEIWKTVKLGTCLKTAYDLRKVIRDCGMKLGNYANDLLGKPAFTVAAVETEVDLVKVTVAKLGFKEGARCDQIYARAKELGLKLCPPEVGPQLRLQYRDQSDGERILIGMKPIRDSFGDLSVFGVWRGDGDLWLCSFCDDPIRVWSADCQRVFVRPRKEQE